ncbi:MAG TPA: low molecular weight phosphotyrosine protein phosphatase, partial [Kofleriaceae bacterium]|nr:low molecular weight phosphotyrosine protein phosphatase [Kofleriaceae bacterium]
MVRVCFVCLGNICRSPTAEGVMRAMIERAGLTGAVEIDSAGTGAWHVGEPADERARAAAARRGF